MFALFAQPHRHLCGATQAQKWEFVHALQQGIQAAEMRQQYCGGLGADAGHTRNVVDGIAAQRQIIGDLVRMHAIAGLDAVHVPALIACVIPLFVVFDQQLRQILVGRDDHPAQALRTRAVQGAADQIVGFVIAVGQHAQPQCRAQRLAMRELAPQRVRCRGAIALVSGVQGVAKTAVQRFVEGDGDVRGVFAFEQVEQEARKAMHRIGRPALRILEFVRDGMPGAEHVQAGIDQVQRGRARAGGRSAVDRGGVRGHGVQSRSNARGSGRSRSGTCMRGVPMWMKPAIRSFSSRPR